MACSYQINQPNKMKEEKDLPTMLFAICLMTFLLYVLEETEVGKKARNN
jgi:hypothetical protein